jgi:N6-adenosine-specific RNA methylase IME4
MIALDFASLAALPIAELAADDCALFLWATDPLLPRAFELLHAWGFEYNFGSHERCAGVGCL